MFLKEYLSKRFAPRWVILQLDILLVVFSFFVSFFIRYNFDIEKIPFREFAYILPAYVVVRVVLFRVFRVYRGITRYTSVQDAKRLFYAITIGSSIVWLFSLILGFVFGKRDLMPLSVGLIDYFACLVLLTSFRIGVKIIYQEITQPNATKINVAIFGAGRSGLITKRTIDQDGESRYKVVVYLDDNPSLAGKIIEGVPIAEYNDEDFERLIKKFGVNELIISIQDISPERKQQIVDLCLQFGVKTKIIPSANKWVNGELSLNQIKKVRIEDLLERDPIKIHNDNIKTELEGKCVIVTGSAGSIGSELVRQIVKYYPKKVILIDQAETPLASFKLEMENRFSYIKFKFVIADVRDLERVEREFVTESPDVVFHVAAYKHVPMMEENPTEAILTNVGGTKNMADLACKYDVEKFIMVSTDKAVNPTNIMGASKRIAEIYVQSLNYTETKTKFITTRFGNVLGSNGSVIPLFRQQIEKGGPITVTHPEITRYFMTIPEACQLILEAGTMGQGGEIYIFDMGRDVKIVDLAKKMIRLSGLEPEKDIQIKFTGLRPGEKIREELLNNKENTLPTHHEKIMVAQVRKYDFDKVKPEIEKMVSVGRTGDVISTVLLMKTMVPEFISNNSQFEKLDKQITRSLS
ncbi:NAD-dependent epimerase/dehydratase family protein [bacterium]|nr:NAD-dependent epimerase/dehydratase family protein [bacterium]